MSADRDLSHLPNPARKDRRVKSLLFLLVLAGCNGELAGPESDSGCPVCPVCESRLAVVAPPLEASPRDVVAPACEGGWRFIPVPCPAGASVTMACFELADDCD